ncbi:hypothetical protein EGI22_01790 [Lacihabitans sp. LS3-19]|uniref:hypothetical protein n=1 Tax=Lacihabitans sp. LS3-19 TaxID=2487335 RepID=UPI0020CF9366|nr:hypothetical protein [Lacihabitans sp. LS3-19]MCP9766621.1 hypothetical protein [Lacihabitans sp. LS3-19]
MKKPLFIFLFLIYCNTSAQSLINIDFGNSILLRPNIGYEYRWKNNAVGSNIRWQRNAHIWISEWPEFVKSSGLNVDLIYKNLSKKYVFAETGIRLTKFEAPMTLYGWRIVSLYNSKNKFEPFIKVGLNTNRNKKVQLDFGIGIGSAFSNKSLEVYKDEFQEVYLQLKTNEKIEDYFKKPKGVEAAWVPHAQLRLFYKFGNKKLNPISLSHTK